MRIIAFFLGASAASLISQAHAEIHGPMPSIDVGGIPMHCNSFSGAPVAIFLNTQLNGVSLSTQNSDGLPIIVMNPHIANRFSPLVPQWWFAQACARHALAPQFNNELNADCFASRSLVRFGLLTKPQQLIAFHQELAALPQTSMGNSPGLLRLRTIQHCAVSP